MTLPEKQQVFAKSLAHLILKAIDLNYQVTIGEVLRTPEEAKENAQQGIGISNSLHLIKLAADLSLFKDGIFLRRVVDYRELGEFWKSLSTKDCTMCWGGDFSTPDADHFSIENNGIK